MRSSWRIQDNCTFSESKQSKWSLKPKYLKEWTWACKRGWEAYLVRVTEGYVIVESIGPCECSIAKRTIVLFTLFHAAQIRQVVASSFAARRRQHTGTVVGEHGARRRACGAVMVASCIHHSDSAYLYVCVCVIDWVNEWMSDQPLYLRIKMLMLMLFWLKWTRSIRWQWWWQWRRDVHLHLDDAFVEFKSKLIFSSLFAC